MLRVMNRDAFENYASERHSLKTSAIIINHFGDPGIMAIENYVNGIHKILWLRYNDTEYINSESGAISKSDVDKIIRFVNENKDAEIIVAEDSATCRCANAVAAAIIEVTSKNGENKELKSLKSNMNRLCFAMMKDKLEEVEELSIVKIDTKDDEPEYIKLSKRIEENILNCEIQYNELLPDIVSMSETFKVSTLTVVKAYERLIRLDLISNASNGEYRVTYRKGIYKDTFDDKKQIEMDKLLHKVIGIAIENGIDIKEVHSLLDIIYNNII